VGRKKLSKVVNRSDPRVQRTRQLLLDAFNSIVVERHNLHSISIQEVTARATVNRATFYAHFEDKYELVACWMCAKFQRTLEQQLPPSSTLGRETLHRLIRTVFDFMGLGHRQHNPSDRQLEPLFEVVLQQELYAFVLKWLQQSPSATPQPAETLEVTAQVMSWAICGPAMRWSHGDRSISAEAMSEHVLTIVMAGLSPVVTVT
jgi:AcrR family transcriptional regulator